MTRPGSNVPFARALLSGASLLFPILVAGWLGACGPSPAERGPAPASLSEGVKAARQLREQGRFTEAIAAYDRVLDRDPRDSAALLDLTALLLRGNRVQEARDRARALLRRVPDSPAAHLALAQAAYRQGDRREAGRLLDRAASLRSSDPAFHAVAARLYRALARTGQGVTLLEDARARGLVTAEMLALLGDLNLRLARPEPAEEAFRAALAAAPDTAAYQTGRGRSLLMMNRKAEAEDAFQAALRLAPEDPYALYYLGTLRLERGEAAEAANFLGRSLQKDALNPKARYALGQALLKLGRSEAAESPAPSLLPAPPSPPAASTSWTWRRRPGSRWST